jgi:hypothetical protein
MWRHKRIKKKCYERRTNRVKDENVGGLADFHHILNRWKNFFCHKLNVHGVNVVRQTEVHTAEPLVPEPSFFEVEIAV